MMWLYIIKRKKSRYRYYILSYYHTFSKKIFSFNSSNMMITPITLHVYYFITTNTKPFFKRNFKY